MNPHIWWYLARATGYVAWALVTTSVISGLLLSTRLTNGRPAPARILDLHRALAGTAVVFTGLHLTGLVADDFVHFGPADLLVPFASAWRPGPVALGVIALYLVVAIEASSLLVRRLPRRIWRTIHAGSYLAFWLATFHLISAGTDAGQPLSQLAAALAMAAVVFLTLVRSLSGRGGRGASRGGARVGERPLETAGTQRPRREKPNPPKTIRTTRTMRMIVRVLMQRTCPGVSGANPFRGGICRVRPMCPSGTSSGHRTGRSSPPV